jgi:hypothetical protein
MESTSKISVLSTSVVSLCFNTVHLEPFSRCFRCYLHPSLTLRVQLLQIQICYYTVNRNTNRFQIYKLFSLHFVKYSVYPKTIKIKVMNLNELYMLGF